MSGWRSLRAVTRAPRCGCDEPCAALGFTTAFKHESFPADQTSFFEAAELQFLFKVASGIGIPMQTVSSRVFQSPDWISGCRNLREIAKETLRIRLDCAR